MASIEMKGHGGELSDDETNEVVEAAADLIVNFLKEGNSSIAGDSKRKGMADEKKA